MKKKSAEQSGLLVDREAWNRAGEELLACDPQRYIAILKIVEDICSIHRDPLGAVCGEGCYVFAQRKSGEFD